ncbi:hypothetical protein DUNSADRAFT_17721 [Dunaliella salina]|uniref:Encoded protein n=1 Tax=Dunaliella salina TaxID=3046 RepID=A0ABQ7GZT9_DUNSA|nr:hypothetical protein DUNSADRAFT_17721 [Dunaliella salina]|eukprot:KAF5840120.1 hypothetical protein DUNSADRAFT_17721 [Dunaliella salina]
MQAYVECPVSQQLPAELHGAVIFQDIHIERATSKQGCRAGTTQSATSSFQFDPKKALRGVGGQGKGSAYESRGDGLLEGGRTVAQRGQYVHLAPGALEGENAERTLQELDAMQQQPKLPQKRQQPPAAKFTSVLHAAGRLLDDIS